MGSYSVLTIAKVEMQWKYYIPPTLAFLFDNTDGYTLFDKEEDYFAEGGFRTTVKKVLSRMESIGYNDKFFSEIYNDFFDDLNQNYEVSIEVHNEDAREIDQQICLDRFPCTTPTEDLILFTKFLSEVIYGDDSINTISIELPGERVFEIPKARLRQNANIYFFGPDAFEDYLYEHSINIPPGIFRIALFFENEKFYEYSDVVLLFSMYLILKASFEEQEVKLNYIELMDDESAPKDDIAVFHEHMTKRLVHKITTYNKVFRVLIEKDSWLNEYYSWIKLEEMWSEVQGETDKYKKGVLLEEFTIALLGMSDDFRVEDKRLNNGDEEIDVLVTNHVNDAFWLALQSPFIFVECKNWVNKVRSKDVRDFQGKLDNHNNLCRMGILISVNGFTTECDEYLKRLGRSNKVLLLITGKDIEKLLSTRESIKLWIESIIPKALV